MRQNLEDAILSKETLSNVDERIRETNIAVVVFHGRSQERIERNKIPEKVLTFLGLPYLRLPGLPWKRWNPGLPGS